MATARMLVAGALIFFALGCAAPRPPAGEPAVAAGLVRVRLMHHERAVPGAVVTAVRNPGVAFVEQRVSARAAADGRGELALAPGTWYVVASASSPELAGWYGSNPVQVRPGEAVDVTVPAVAAPAPAAAAGVPVGEEAVVGVVTLEGQPVAGAGVTFYLDGTTLFRGPGYVEAVTDASGAFEARVSPGRYWLVARRRAGALAFGPLEVGDDFGFYPRNPVAVGAGERVAVGIPVVRVLKKSGWAGPSTLRLRVAGTIRDRAGRPLAGYRAFLHAKQSMLGKPEFVSEPSGPDGSYLIWVDREGRYYLGARAEIGRAREEREAIGVPVGAPDPGIDVRLGEGDLVDRDIVVGVGDDR